MHCLDCGAFIPEGAQFCPACGRARPAAQPSPVQANPAGAPWPERRAAAEGPSDRVVLAAVIASAVMLVVAGVLWYAASRREASAGRAAVDAAKPARRTTAPRPSNAAGNNSAQTPAPTATPQSNNGVVAATPLQASTTERIEFSRGRTSSIVSGSVGLDAPASYLLRAGQGQRMRVRLASSGGGRAHFDIYPPQASSSALAEQAEDWTGELPATGDYVLRVYTTAGASAYTLEVTVR